jgi:hypothetical protein
VRVATGRGRHNPTRHLRVAGAAVLLVGLGIAAATAALAGPAARSRSDVLVGWRLTVRVVGYNSTNPGVKDASLPVGHRGTDYVSLTPAASRRDDLAALPSGRHGFVSSDGLVGPTARHPLTRSGSTWSDTFPWPVASTHTTCAAPKVVLSLTVKGTSLKGSEQVPLSFNCYRTETWYTQTVSLKIRGTEVSAVGTGSPLEEPRTGGPFAISRLTYPKTVVAGGAPGDLRAFWTGRPDFPLVLTEQNISCPPGITCGNETTEVTLRENPEVFVDALDCTGVTSRKRFRYRITLHDAAGHHSRTAVESFSCKP